MLVQHILLEFDAINVSFFYCIFLCRMIYLLNLFYFFKIIVFGCNPLTNSQAVSCTNGATCVNNACVCTSNATIGTLCEIRMLNRLKIEQRIFIDTYSVC